MKLPHLLWIIALAAACAQSTGSVKGGEITDAGDAAVTPAPFVPSICEGQGSKWSELYRDVFGPTGRPGSCSFKSRCHGSPEGDGAKSGNGIECFDEAKCRQSLFDRGLVKASDKDNPENAVLLTTILRRRPEGVDGGTTGYMPQEPSTYVFPESCIDRMKDWIRNGGPAD